MALFDRAFLATSCSSDSMKGVACTVPRDGFVAPNGGKCMCILGSGRGHWCCVYLCHDSFPFSYHDFQDLKKELLGLMSIETGGRMLNQHILAQFICFDWYGIHHARLSLGAA